MYTRSLSPVEQLTDMASQLIAAIVSCTRVDALLEEEETTKYAMIARPSTASEPKIGFVNAAFTWADADSALDDTNIFKLKNLNLDFLVDGLNLVVGPVGSVSLAIERNAPNSRLMTFACRERAVFYTHCSAR